MLPCFLSSVGVHRPFCYLQGEWRPWIYLYLVWTGLSHVCAGKTSSIFFCISFFFFFVSLSVSGGVPFSCLNRSPRPPISIPLLQTCPLLLFLCLFRPPCFRLRTPPIRVGLAVDRRGCLIGNNYFVALETSPLLNRPEFVSTGVCDDCVRNLGLAKGGKMVRSLGGLLGVIDCLYCKIYCCLSASHTNLIPFSRVLAIVMLMPLDVFCLRWT